MMMRQTVRQTHLVEIGVVDIVHGYCHGREEVDHLVGAALRHEADAQQQQGVVIVVMVAAEEEEEEWEGNGHRHLEQAPRTPPCPLGAI